MKAALLSVMAVGTGGFIGALARYGLTWLVHRQAPASGFPYGTLAANLLGCFAVGLIAGLVESRQLFGPEFRKFAVIGVLGGFTTFSAFGYETFVMIRNDQFFRAAANVTIQVILGLALVWLGHVIATGK